MDAHFQTRHDYDGNNGLQTHERHELGEEEVSRLRLVGTRSLHTEHDTVGGARDRRDAAGKPRPICTRWLIGTEPRELVNLNTRQPDVTEIVEAAGRRTKTGGLPVNGKHPLLSLMPASSAKVFFT